MGIKFFFLLEYNDMLFCCYEMFQENCHYSEKKSEIFWYIIKTSTDRIGKFHRICKTCTL